MEFLNFLAKIEAAEVNNDARITDADRDAMLTLHDQRDAILKQLTRWKAVFESELEKFTGAYTRESYRKDHLSFHQTHDNNDPFSRLWYFPGYSLEYIHKALIKVQRRFVEEIIKHFNGTYQLNLTFDQDYNNYTSYSDVIDWIFSQVGGFSLTEKGIENRITSLADLTRLNGAKLGKNTIDFNRLYVLESDVWGDSLKFPYYQSNGTGERYYKLLDCLHFFDTGKLTGEISVEMVRGEKLDAGKIYKVEGRKVTGIKFYKNHRVTIYFKDAAAAAEFYALFRMSQQEAA